MDALDADRMTRGEVAGALVALVNTLMVDGDLTDDDLGRIREAAVRERKRIGAERTWAETAHVHDEPHAPVVTFAKEDMAVFKAMQRAHADPDSLQPGDHIPEQVDASGVICHDCRRDLVSDAGSLRILVCPSLHGRRPRDLVPRDPDGAVECGRVG